MSEAYQAIYDAAIRVIDCDLPSRVQTALSDLVAMHERPSVLYRPRLYLDGDAWCALYGENIQDGVCAFGFSPEEAVRNFDIAWFQKLRPKSSSMSTSPHKNAEDGYDEEFRRTEKLQAKLRELFPDGPEPFPGHPNNPIAIWSQAQLEAARNALEIERAKGGG